MTGKMERKQARKQTNTTTEESGELVEVGPLEGALTPEAREPERQDLAADVEAFLNSGGEIKAVPKDFRADPPRRPENNYGRGSI